MYLEIGPVTNGAKKSVKARYGFALKIGKGKLVAASPSFGSRAIALRKAKNLMERLDGCDTVYEVQALK